MWEWHAGGAWGWWMMIPMMLVFWGGLGWMIVSTFGPRNRSANANVGVSAKEILDRRYASGEINESDYSRISGLLKD